VTPSMTKSTPKTKLYGMLLAGLVAIVLPAQIHAQNAPDPRVENKIDALTKTYKQIHEHPELSAEEKETSALLAGELRRLGFDVTERVGKYDTPGKISYGVVGVLKNGPGSTVMVRTELDALPVEERTGLPYASHVKTKTPDGEVSVMHACGHDLHMASWIGTAQVLVEAKKEWSGTLIMIAQPAEESGGGALPMLQDGLYTRFPRPDFVLALHDNPTVAAGKVAWKGGPLLAGSDTVDILVRGFGGHGAAPHMTKDPVVIASEIVVMLQTIVSREVDPFDSAVVTVGTFHAGTKANIIPDEARLQLSVRTMKPEVREKVLAAIQRIAANVAAAAGVPQERAPVVKLMHTTPPTINNDELAKKVGAALQSALGKENVLPADAIMASEDFSQYGLTNDKVPYCMFWLGATSPQRLAEAKEKGTRLPGLHSSEFYPEPEAAIRTGVKGMSGVVMELLKK
jgi:amidohydrolase